MTIAHKSARLPGPIGISAGGVAGRVPGPLGYRSVVVAQVAVAKVAGKATDMPPPSQTSTMMEARKVTWPLFPGDPAATDVRQGELATCPIASILAAMAHTPWGRKRIKDELVKEFKGGVVKTTLSDATLKDLKSKLDDPDYRTPQKVVVSDRYFSVSIGNPPIEVSDVLYIKYTDGTMFDPMYMQARPPAAPDKAREALWPAAIEKAYAQTVGGYQKLDEYGPKGTTVDVYWKVLTGSKPETIAIKDATDQAIRAAATAAGRSPTIAATKETTSKLSDRHGYAVLGIQGSRIDLYDPWGKSVKVSIAEFKADVELVLRKP